MSAVCTTAGAGICILPPEGLLRRMSLAMRRGLEARWTVSTGRSWTPVLAELGP